jgi:hypothetical protein
VVQACLRSYAIHTPDGKAYPIYVEVLSNGDLGQYYDIQGTTWTAAPLFSHPTQTLRVGRRTYLLFYEGSHLETIAWRQYGAVYWVHNTLTDALGNGGLLAIAEQTTGRQGPHLARARDPQGLLRPQARRHGPRHTSDRVGWPTHWPDCGCPAATRPVRCDAQSETAASPA